MDEIESLHEAIMAAQQVITLAEDKILELAAENMKLKRELTELKGLTNKDDPNQ